MTTATLHVMAKAKRKTDPTPEPSLRKRKTISLRVDADLLDAVDAYCDDQEIPIDRTAFIEVAMKRFLKSLQAKDE